MRVIHLSAPACRERRLARPVERRSRLTQAAVALALCCLGPAAGLAQARSDRLLHDRVVAIIVEQSKGGLPRGDTSVSWRPDSPILYHTAFSDSGVVRTGMVRNDGLLGTLETRWSGAAPRSFVSAWSKNGAVLLSFTGTVAGSSIAITAKGKVSSVAIPAMRWAVADIGMEDQLLPVFLSMHAGDSIRVAVFRPYASRWDTVAVKRVAATVAPRIILYQGATAPLQIDLSADGAILRIVRGADFERRPLELSRRAAQYAALKGK